MNDKLNPGELNQRIEVWGMSKGENEIGEEDYTAPQKLKTIWAHIIPQTGKLQNQTNPDTVTANTTHKIIVRYGSGKDIKDDMYIMYFENQIDSNIYVSVKELTHSNKNYLMLK